MTSEERKKKHWVPLESDPAILQAVATKLGLDTARCRFSDVLGTDDELLALVPHPVYALVLLGPDVIEKRIPPDVEVLPTPQNDLVFIKQTIGHACGTMAMLHAVLNSAAPVHSSSLLAALGDRCRGLAADEGARVLENSDELEQAHTSEAKKGQTVAPDPFDSVGFGYCALVVRQGRLLELAGYKDGPLDHGPLQRDLLHDSIRVLKKYMELVPDSAQFSLVALCSAA